MMGAKGGARAGAVGGPVGGGARENTRGAVLLAAACCKNGPSTILQFRSTREYSSAFNSYRDMKCGVVLPTNKTDQKLTPPTTVHQLNQLTNHLLVTRFVFPPLAHLNSD
jgi:hypothetical protein